MTILQPGMLDGANAEQIAGDHYRSHGRADIQHWDLVHQYKLDYFQGQITKYVMRWKHKNGLEDLKKASHYLQKYLEINDRSKLSGASAPVVYKHWGLVSLFKLDFFQGTVVMLVMYWKESHGITDLISASDCLITYINEVKAETEARKSNHEDVALGVSGDPRSDDSVGAALRASMQA